MSFFARLISNLAYPNYDVVFSTKVSSCKEAHKGVQFTCVSVCVVECIRRIRKIRKKIK